MKFYDSSRDDKVKEDGKEQERDVADVPIAVENQGSQDQPSNGEFRPLLAQGSKPEEGRW